MTTNDKNRLRSLAQRQRELAYSPQMEALRSRYWELNTKKSGTLPTVRIETAGFANELIPQSECQCTDKFARLIENQILYYLYHYSIVGDDQLVPKTFQIRWRVNVDYFGFPVSRTTGTAANGSQLGYRVDHAINSIAEDFHKLKPLKASVDREFTGRLRAAAEESIGDLLPVEMTGWPALATFLTRQLLDLMSMENFYLAMMDSPDDVHRLMEYLLQNALILMNFWESEGIMSVNNGETDLQNSTYPFTDKLPAPGFSGRPRLIDMYLRTDSQETVGISPEMFAEFCLPYYKRLCAMAGLWYYGCCEPVHPIWEQLSAIPNIKKVSISKWCNEEIMGQHLRNSGIIYTRKLDAVFAGLDKEIDAEGLARYVRTTMKKAQGCQIEFIYREIPTTYGNPGKLKTVTDIIRREINR
ncbi:MAG: hypothetical protein FWF22_07660 [Treponema sp.]|nr:hypothetical protein [Treponema sp.]